MDLTITSVTLLAPLPTTNQVAVLSYKFYGDVIYTPIPGTTYIQPDGTFVSPVVITGLANDACYDVKIETDCSVFVKQYCIGNPPSTTTTQPTTTSSSTTTTVAPTTSTTSTSSSTTIGGTTTTSTTVGTTTSSTTTSTTIVGTTTTTSTTAAPLIAYWGWKPANTILTPAEITASPNSQTVTPPQNITCSFAGGYGTPLYLWMAEPVVCSAKTKWQDTVQAFNNGNIGTNQDLFDSPVISGGFRFYITVYLTEQINPIQFKVI